MTLAVVRKYRCTDCNYEFDSTKPEIYCPACLADKCPDCNAPHWDNKPSVKGLFYLEKDLRKNETGIIACCGACGWEGTLEKDILPNRVPKSRREL